MTTSGASRCAASHSVVTSERLAGGRVSGMSGSYADVCAANIVQSRVMCNCVALALLADRNHRLVGSLAVDVPELLEIGPVKVGQLLADIGQRRLELIGLRNLADRRAQCGDDWVRRALRREDPDPQIIFDVV